MKDNNLHSDNDSQKWEVLYSTGKAHYKPIILEKLKNKFDQIDFTISLDTIHTKEELLDPDWHILFGYCLAWEELLST